MKEDKEEMVKVAWTIPMRLKEGLDDMAHRNGINTTQALRVLLEAVAAREIDIKVGVVRTPKKE